MEAKCQDFVLHSTSTFISPEAGSLRIHGQSTMVLCCPTATGSVGDVQGFHQHLLRCPLLDKFSPCINAMAQCTMVIQLPAKLSSCSQLTHAFSKSQMQEERMLETHEVTLLFSKYLPPVLSCENVMKNFTSLQTVFLQLAIKTTVLLKNTKLSTSQKCK